MAEFITIEPSGEHRAAFARWALDQDPNVQTVGTHGFVVPLDWYPDVPAELLAGSYVDGYAYETPSGRPKAASGSLAAETREPVVRVPDAPAKPLAAEQKPRRAPRKRAPRKPKDADA